MCNYTVITRNYITLQLQKKNTAPLYSPEEVVLMDGAGWLARRVQTGRRVKLAGPVVRGWYEPCTFDCEELPRMPQPAEN